MATPRVHVPTELHMYGQDDYAEGGATAVEVNARFVGPSGQEWLVPGFWRGGRRYSLRFAAPEPGCYTYSTECSNAADAGLHARSGELEVLPGEAPDGLYTHGRLRVAASRRTLEHVDGTPFFWLGDTWWMGLSKRLDWPDGFNLLAQDRAQKGFSLVQIVAGPLPDFDAVDGAWQPQQANEGGWPWEPEWQQLNPAFYDCADRRIAALVEQGLVPCIVGMWGFYLPEMGVERVRLHWRNLVARYAAYPVVWCLAGEVDMPTYSLADPGARAEQQQAQRAGWTEIGAYVRRLDPFHNPLTAHPAWGVDARETLADDALLDVDMLQTGHSGYGSLRRSIDSLYTCLAKEPAMPVLNAEACYEGIMGGSSQEVQRFLFWSAMLSAAAGHTYGAQGVWNMSSREEPFSGWTASWGEAVWQDAMHLPGGSQVGLGRRLLSRYPWWRFEPRVPEGRERSLLEEAGREYCFAAGVPGQVWLFYLAAGCMERAFQGYQGSAFGGTRTVPQIAIEPGTMYTATYVNPRTGSEVHTYAVRGGFELTLGRVVPDADGFWAVPPKPTMEDWLLVLEAGQADI